MVTRKSALEKCYWQLNPEASEQVDIMESKVGIECGDENGKNEREMEIGEGVVEWVILVLSNEFMFTFS